MEGKEDQAVYRYDNSSYTVPTVIGLRLNTEVVVQELERFLTGTAEKVKQLENGMYITEQVQIGEPLANEKGVQYMLLRIKAIFNSQTVQGNFKEDALQNYLADIEEGLGVMICLNSDAWEIKIKDQDVIVDYIMNLIEPFMTRTINNKERDSYANTIEHKESSVVQEKGGFGFFKK